MRDHLFVKMTEQYIKKYLTDTLLESPINSMTPFVVEREDGIEEYLFVCKTESWIYEPLQGKSINSRTRIGAKSYIENDNLIFGFDVEPDINLESEILKEKIVGFLKRLYVQDKITIAIVDYITLNIVWVVHYHFGHVRNNFNTLFKYYGIIE